VKLFLPVFVTVLLLGSLPLHAQQQERKLLDRIQRPDMNLGNPLQSKNYEGTGNLKIKSAWLGDKSFAGTKAAPLKEFSGARSFLGIKNPWFGKRTYDTKLASLTGRGGLAKLDTGYAVKDAATRAFPSATKSPSLNSGDVAVRPFLNQGGTQGALDQISDKVKKEMTIDEVRELLNKNR